MKGFYHIWAWRPSWSCDLDFLYTHWFPLPIDASYKIWLWLAKRFQRRRSLKLWTDGRQTDGRTDDGRTPDHGHPISSPCEPNGSGELKIGIPLHTPVLLNKIGVKGGYISRTCFPDVRASSRLVLGYKGIFNYCLTNAPC